MPMTRQMRSTVKSSTLGQLNPMSRYKPRQLFKGGGDNTHNVITRLMASCLRNQMAKIYLGCGRSWIDVTQMGLRRSVDSERNATSISFLFAAE